VDQRWSTMVNIGRKRAGQAWCGRANRRSRRPLTVLRRLSQYIQHSSRHSARDATAARAPRVPHLRVNSGQSGARAVRWRAKVLVRGLAGQELDRCQTFQAGHAGSIPVTRSRLPSQVNNGADHFPTAPLSRLLIKSCGQRAIDCPRAGTRDRSQVVAGVAQVRKWKSSGRPACRRC
jgi:hypothetical protein